jgi:hypothetical protein
MVNIKNKLRNEDSEDGNYRGKYKEKWRPTQSSFLTQSFYATLNGNKNYNEFEDLTQKV